MAHGRDFAGGGAAVTSVADGTGRPADLPGRGWWEVLRRVRLALARDHIWVAAAGVAYCTLFAAIPGVTVVIAFVGLLADRARPTASSR